MSIQTMLFDQDYVTEMYERELFEEGKAEGLQQGREQERNEIFERLVKQGLLSKEEVKKQLALMK